MTLTHRQPTERSASAELGQYVAWLASRIDDETVRRRCRRVAQAYLEWSWADGGASSTRRSRFVPAAARWLQLSHTQVDSALDLYFEYRVVVARTLPIDG